MSSAISFKAAERDRSVLVELRVDLHDRFLSSGLGDKMSLSLRRIDVELVGADGEPFDPSAHEALGEVETTEARRDGVIAATERSGYTDHRRLAGEPAVLVYRLTDGSRAR